MKTHWLFVFGILLFLTSCSPARAPIGFAADFLPSHLNLKRGIVNKYYFHYTSDDGFEKTTSIEYRHYQLEPDGHLLVKLYDPGFQLLRSMLFRFENDQMRMIKDEVVIRTRDTFPTLVLEDQYINWRDGESSFKNRTDYGKFGAAEIKEDRTPYPDTLILERPAKRFLRSRVRTFYPPEGDPNTIYSEYIDIYVGGIGLFQVTAEFEDGTGVLELVEQMSWTDFEQRQRQAPRRVAYIHPDDRLDADRNFAPCDSPHKIYDYYNGDPDGGFPGGKKALWEFLRPQLNAGLFANTSGYLTFRFVINCQGQTGWFITEEADLNFLETEFPPTLKTHLLELIQNLPPWRACVIRGEDVDSYAYLTFKFQDGELIELLP